MLSTGSTEVYSKHLLDTLKNSVITCCTMEKKTANGKETGLFSVLSSTERLFCASFFSNVAGGGQTVISSEVIISFHTGLTLMVIKQQIFNRQT